MKVALLGPAPPFHGGIVTYLAMLARALEGRGHQLFWASFAAQYPKLIFPGTDQTGDTAPWLERPNRPRFVPWSPLSWRRTAADIRDFAPDLLISKYWIPYFAPGFGSVMRGVGRDGRTRRVYILDNVIAHEKYPFAGAMTRWALRPADGYVAQSDQVRRDLFTVLPDVDPAKVITSPHPVYDFGEPGRPRKSRVEARRALGLDPDGPVALFFGYIKPYKGVRHLIDAAPLMRDRLGDKLQVLIVGDVYGDRAEYVERIEHLGVGDVISFRDGFVPDETVEDYFLACDVVVLPYVSATQSGIVQIAYNYDKPVVSTRVGGLPEVVLDGETGFLVPPADPPALADAVTRFFREDRAADFAAGVAREKSKYSWDHLCAAVESFADGRNEGEAR